MLFSTNFLQLFPLPDSKMEVSVETVVRMFVRILASTYVESGILESVLNDVDMLLVARFEVKSD